MKLKMPSITSITSRRAIKQPSNNCYNSLFPLQTPVERSERVAGCWAVRARANPLSLGVWHFTLRFVLPRSWVGYPSRRPKGCGMQSPSGPKVYPKYVCAQRSKSATFPAVQLS